MINLEMFVLEIASGAVEVSINWLVQSTMLISAGLAAGRLFRRRGSAFQSVIYRTTLAAVLVCPIISLVFSTSGFDGWSIELPKPFSYRVESPVDAIVGSSIPVVSESSVEDRVILNEASNVETSAAVPLVSTFAHPPEHAADSPGTNANSMSAALPMDAFKANTAVVKHDTVAAEHHTFRISSFGLFSVVLLGVWACVAALLLARLTCAIRYINRLRRMSVEGTVDDVATCRQIARQMNLAVPEVLRTPFLTTPVLHGLVKPAVMLPEEADLPLTSVFTHELAHLQRRDFHWLLLRRLVMTVLFFQPLLFWLGRRIGATAEEVCDDYVVQLGGNRAAYATSLVDIASSAGEPLVPGGVGIVSLRSLLGQRVERIMDTSRSRSTRVGNLFFILVVVSGLISTTITGLVGLSPTTISAQTASDQAPAPATDSGNDETVAGEVALDAPTVASAEPANDESPSESPIKGRVVSSSGKPVARAKFYWYRTRVHDIDPMMPKLICESGKDGSFSWKPPVANQQHEAAAWSSYERIVVVAPGHGFETTSTARLRTEKRPGSLLGALAKAIMVGTNQTNIQLPSSGEPLRGRIVDIDGQPVAGATIRIRHFTEGDAQNWQQVDFEVREKQGAEWRARLRNLLSTIEPVSMRFALPSATTNPDGRFELKDVGARRLFQLLIEGEGIHSADIVSRNIKAKHIVVPSDRHAQDESTTIYGNDFVYVVGPSNPIEGLVTDLDTGEPITGAVVRATSVHGERVSSSRERQHFATRTDENGRYRIAGMPVGEGNRLVVFTTDDVPYIPVGGQVDTSQANESLRTNFRLKRGVWAEGQVINGATGRPFTGEMTYYWFRDPSLEEAYPGVRRTMLDGRYYTNRRGEFGIPVLPTRGIIAYRWEGPPAFGGSREIDKFPRGLGAAAIPGMEERMRAFPTEPHYLIPGNYNYVAEVNPDADDNRVRVEMTLTASKPIRVQIVAGNSAEPLPLSDYLVYGLNERWGWQRGRNATDLAVEDLNPNEKRKVLAFHRKRGLAGGVTVHEDVEQPVSIALAKAGTVLGRLVDGVGDPINDATVSVNYELLNDDDKYAIWAPHPKLNANPTQIPVDEEGRFELDGLIPGWKYSARASAPRKLQGRMVSFGIGDVFEDVTINPGETRDLGDIQILEEN